MVRTDQPNPLISSDDLAAKHRKFSEEARPAITAVEPPEVWLKSHDYWPADEEGDGGTEETLKINSQQLSKATPWEKVRREFYGPRRRSLEG